MLLHLGRDGDAFAHQDRAIQSAAQARSAGIVDPGQRLQRTRRRPGAFGQPAAEIVPVAAHGERGGADRAAEVEGEDLRRVAPELQSHQRQQHGLARAGRADDQRVADIADMKGKPERGRAFGLAEKQGGRTEMLVPFRPRPHGRQRDHVGEIERGDRRLADIGVGMARQAPSQASTR
jgi:hypothetical protein